MSFPRYEEYKDSGVEWLGDAPAHWKVVRLRHIAELNPSKSEVSKLDRELPVSFLPMEAVGDDGTIQLEHTRPIGDVENGYTYFREGDVTLAKITPCFENGKGAVMRGLLNGVGFGTTELIVVRPHPECTTSHFLQCLFMSSYFRRIGESTMYGAGGQKRLPEQFVRNFATAIPPLDEQRAIASFLDRETSKIDTLVSEQRRLVELLKEKRQAVISHAVTKGLDPTVPMKPSGIEWLGDVPAHWEVQRVKAVTSFVTSGPRGWSERIAETGALFIQSGDLDDKLNINFEGCNRVQVENDAEAARTQLLEGDVVICVTGAKTGNVAICKFCPEVAYVNQHVCLIRPTQKMNSSYLGIQLKSDLGQTYFAVSQYGLKQGLSLENVKDAPVVRPPLREQVKIVDFVLAENDKFNSLVTEAERAIVLLQERRTALISAAVTGKIDVRAVALEGARP